MWTTTDEVFRILAQSSDPRVRRYVAHNHYCPPDVLDMLADDEDLEVVMEVAEHLATNSAILHRMSQNADAWIGWRIAEHDNALAPTLIHLASHESPLVREAVAKAKRTPLHILDGLAVDDESEVCKAAIRSLMALLGRF